MSSIVKTITGGITGNSGGAGANYNAQGVNILNPSSVDQATKQYQNAMGGLSQQQQFLAAVQAQNGLGNQSQVFNQLQGVANGTGPNPAQAQLAQSTGQNVANQAALMAGQRGSSQNVGLMARQAAQVGGNLQQQVAGQAATLQANQSLNALNNMGSLATSQANQQANATQGYASSTQNEQQNILNSIAQQNNANVGMQSNVNSANAGIANTVAGGQFSLLGNAVGGAGSALAMAEGGSVQKPQMIAQGGAAPVTTELQQTSGPRSKVGQYLSNNPNVMSSAMPNSGAAAAGQAIGKGFGSGIKSLGGMFSSSDDSDANPSTTSYNPGTSSGSIEDFAAQQKYENSPEGQSLLDTASGKGTTPTAAAMQLPASNGLADGGMASNIQTIAKLAPMLMAMAQGGRVPAMVSPGEQYLPPKDVKKVVKEGKNPLKAGERIPGKPKFPGNDYRNDVVPKTLKEGGIVIPNAVMQSKDPAAAAAKFVAAHCKQQALSKKAK